MGQIVFQATLGGQVAVAGPNTASSFTLTLPAATDTLVGKATTDTLTNKTLTSPTITGATLTTSAFNGTVGATTASTGAFTTLSTSSTTTLSGLTASTALALDASKNVVSVTNTGTGNNVLSASPTLTGTIAGASLSLSSLTSGRVTYATTSGLLTDSANLTFDGTNLIVQNNGDVTARSYSTNASNQSFIQAVNSSNIYIGLLQYGASKAVYGALGAGGGALYSVANVTVMADNPTGFINFATGGNTERMRITSAGNVGIGNTNPGSFDASANRLVVGDGSANQGISIYGSSTANLFFASGTSGSAAYKGFINYTFSTDVMAFNVAGGNEAMRIDASRNLLVGTTSSIGNGGVLQAKGSGPVFYVETNSSSGSQNVIDIANVSNTAYKPMRFWVNGYGTTEVGSITCTTSLTSYNVTSDYRLKENIVPMTGALAKVAQLKPVTYKWKTDGSDGQGFIAHELAEVVPDCVTGEKDAVDENGKPIYQAMDTSHLVATLVSAIQELKAEFDAYKSTHP